jgi:hypothetical protein
MKRLIQQSVAPHTWRDRVLAVRLLSAGVLYLDALNHA